MITHNADGSITYSPNPEIDRRERCDRLSRRTSSTCGHERHWRKLTTISHESAHDNNHGRPLTAPTSEEQNGDEQGDAVLRYYGFFRSCPLGRLVHSSPKGWSNTIKKARREAGFRIWYNFSPDKVCGKGYAFRLRRSMNRLPKPSRANVAGSGTIDRYGTVPIL